MHVKPFGCDDRTSLRMGSYPAYRHLVGALVFILITLQSLFAQTASPPDIFLELLVEGLTFPTDVQNAGDGSNRLFIAQQSGEVLIYDPSQNGLLPTPFLDISNLITFAGEEGLFSLAFHPRYEVNGRFFVHYIDTNRNAVVARFTVSANDPNRANPEPDAILLTIQRPDVEHHHDGGQIQFGPDGFLYIALGDLGFVDDSPNNGQNLGVLHGKILRLDVDSAEPYAIPPTNPFVGDPEARGEIWAYGLRNPWRFSFDRLTGEAFIADVGLERREEVSLQPAGSPGGENYGWRLMEGSLCFIPATDCNDGSLVLPIIEYGHIDDPCGGSISGGYRYRGRRFPQLNGVYFYGDFCFGQLYGAIQQPDGSWTSTELLGGFGGIVTFGEDEDGEVYVTDFFFPGFLYRIGASNPIPALTALSPESTGAGVATFDLIVRGTGFVSGAVVRWNGSDRNTTFVNSTELRATITADDVAVQGSAQVTVFDPAPGGGTSNPLTFTISPPLPDPRPAGTLQTIIPHSASGGGFLTRVFITNITNETNTVIVNRINQSGAVVETTSAELQPGATRLISDDEEERGQNLAIEWFGIASEHPISASVLFDFDSQSLGLDQDFRTAVGTLAAEPLNAFTVPVRIATVEVTVGLALANLNNSVNTLNLQLFDQNGIVVAQDSIGLGSFGQIAFSLQDRDAFRDIILGVPEFIGSLKATTADTLLPVTALVIANNLGQLTAVPVSPLTFDSDIPVPMDPAPGVGERTFIPHSATGGGFLTRVSLTNLSNAINTVTLNRYDQDGQRVDNRVISLGPAHTVVLVDSEGARTETLSINWFALRSDSEVIASVLFDFDAASLGLADDFRTAVGAVPSLPLTAFTAPVRVATVDVTVGLALANLTNGDNAVTLKLLDASGNLLAEDSFVLGPLAQIAFSVHERDAFRDSVLGTEEFLGSLAVTTTEPVAALAVGNNLNQLFSLPVVPGVPR